MPPIFFSEITPMRFALLGLASLLLAFAVLNL